MGVGQEPEEEEVRDIATKDLAVEEVGRQVAAGEPWPVASHSRRDTMVSLCVLLVVAWPLLW